MPACLERMPVESRFRNRELQDNASDAEVTVAPKRIGKRTFQAAMFIYKDDSTGPGIWSEVRKIHKTHGHICGEWHTKKRAFLNGLRDWNRRTDPTNAFLCVYAHAGKQGLNCIGGIDRRLVSWEELGETLRYPIQYLWLVGCRTRECVKVWHPLHGPIRHLLLATSKSAPFAPLVKCFADEIRTHLINP
jgi:hypothetical protein